MKRWLKRAYHHHAQSRELNTLRGILVRPGAWCKVPKCRVPCRAESSVPSAPAPGTRHGTMAPGSLARGTRSCHQHPIEQALELLGTLGELAVALFGGVTAAKQLVRDIQRGQHREAERIAARGGVRRRAHLLVDERGEPQDILRIEG